MKKLTLVKNHISFYFKNLSRERIAVFICIPLALVALSICAIMLVCSNDEAPGEPLEAITLTEGVTEKIIYPPDSAYSLAFESLGNGECAISGIGGFLDLELKIPEKSPNGETVVEIKANAFNGCATLETISIPPSVTSIGNGAFRNCPSLIYIDVDSDNEHFTSISGVLFSKNKTRLLYYPPKKVGEKYYLNPNVKQIDDYAFEGALELKSINYPLSTAEFEAISIGKGNDILHSLPITCNYTKGK